MIRVNINDGDRRRVSREQFERYYPSERIGALTRVVWPYYFYEIAKTRTGHDIALLCASPRAHQFWFVCGLVIAAPVVMVIMFLLREGL